MQLLDDLRTVEGQREKKAVLTFLILNFLMPIAFILLVLYFVPISQIFQMDTDEGIQLASANLYSQGYHLYSDISKDQPPFHTILLAHWLGWFGNSITAARFLTLCFSTLLVWSFCQLVYTFKGLLPTLFGFIWLFSSTHFLKLTTAVMIGLPALSLALTGLLFLVKAQQYNSLVLLLFSAILLALAIQTKLFVLPLLPVFIGSIILLFGVWRDRPTDTLKSRWVYLGVWLMGFTCSSILLMILMSVSQPQELIMPHVGVSTREAYLWIDSFIRVLLMYFKDFDLTVMAVLATVFLWQKRMIVRSIPLLWLLVATSALAVHTPVWYHHYLLISIPLIWLATDSVIPSLNSLKKSFSHIQNKLHQRGKLNVNSGFSTPENTTQNSPQPKQKLNREKIAATFLLISLLVMPFKLMNSANKVQTLLHEDNLPRQVVNVIAEHQAETNWLLTDMPIYGFYTNLKTVPELTVISQKRWRSGQITLPYVEEKIREYKPEQIVIARFDEIADLVEAEFGEQYQLVFENEAASCYLKMSA